MSNCMTRVAMHRIKLAGRAGWLVGGGVSLCLPCRHAEEPPEESIGFDLALVGDE